MLLFVKSFPHRQKLVYCICFLLLQACTAAEQTTEELSDLSLNLQTQEDQILTFKPVREEFQSLQFAALQNPFFGEFIDNQDGSYDYQPNANYSGTDRIQYILSDGRFGEVNINVVSVNDAPVANKDIKLMRQAQVTIDPLANDFDVEGDDLNITAVSQSADGTVTLNNNMVSFTPNAGFVGEALISYDLSDGSNTVTGEISFFVLGDLVTLQSLQIEPAIPQVALNDVLDLRATGQLSDGSSLDLTNLVTWRSSSENIAVFDASLKNRIIPVAVGTSLVNILYDGRTAARTVTVLEARPDKPKNVSAKSDYQKIIIDWQAAKGATQYNLYVRQGGGSMSVIPNVTPPYTHDALENGTSYQYRVSALNGSGESEMSQEAVATTLDAPPNIQIDASLLSEPGKFTLQWTPVANIRYEIYWSDEVFLDINNPGLNANLVASAVSPWELTDPLVHNRRYYFAVTAYDENNANVGTVFLNDIFQALAPDVTQLTSVDTSGYTNTISWPTQAGLVYHLYWHKGSPFNFASSEEISRLTSPYVHSNLGVGQYSYSLVTEDSNGLRSPLSDPITATILGAVSPENSTATISNNGLNTTNFIIVQAKDAVGANWNQGGDQLVVTITLADGGIIRWTTENGGVVDAGDGSYSASYLTALPGIYTIAITFNGIAIANSPFTNVVAGTPFTFEWANPKPQGNDINDLVWANAKFVGVGTLGAVVTSTNGTSWNFYNMPIKDSLRRIYWNSDLSQYIAVGDSLIHRSPDATAGSWSLDRIDLEDLCWDGSRYVGVSNDTQPGAYINYFHTTDSNGENWTRQSVNNFSTERFIDIECNPGASEPYVGIGYSNDVATGSFIASSANGIDWTIRHRGATQGGTFQRIKRLSGQLHVVGSYTYGSSADGISWNVETGPQLFSSPSMHDVASSGTDIVLVGRDNNYSRKVGDTLWTKHPAVQINRFFTVQWDGAKFVAAGDHGMIHNFTIAADNSMSLSKPVDIMGYSDFQSMASNGKGLYLAVGNNVMSSTDGLNWSPVVSNLNSFVFDIKYDATADLFIAVGSHISTSRDGITWTRLNNGVQGSYQSVAWNPARTAYVVVGSVNSQGLVLTSANLNPTTSWAEQIMVSPPQGTLVQLLDVIWDGTQFVAAGYQSVIYRSVNGQVWSMLQDTALPSNVVGLASNGTHLVAAGWGGLYRSDNGGDTWAEVDRTWVNDVHWTGSRFISMGSRGEFLSSSDGALWQRLQSPSNHFDLETIYSVGTDMFIVGPGAKIIRITE